MGSVRAALYLDFDNFFNGLVQLEPDAALQFAQAPAEWLDRLTDRSLLEGRRRWLVLRCYMNPAGFVADARLGPDRVYFSKFRPYFTRAGFEVIDCPSLTYRHKNAADIRMALDIVDALNGPTRYDEFVIGSSDADFTPLVQKLRAADRQTTVLSPGPAAVAYAAVADRYFDEGGVVDLILGADGADDAGEVDAVDVGVDGLDLTVAGAAARLPDAPGAGSRSGDDVGGPGETAPERPDAGLQESFRSLITRSLESSDEPVNLARLAQQVRNELGTAVERTSWLGNGSFARAIQSLGLPDVELSHHHVWLTSRHEPPRTADAGHLADPVARLSAVVDVPRLPREAWQRLFDTLAAYAAGHRFNLTESTRWTRDTLATEGVDVARTSVGFVIRGAMYGGTPLNRVPPPGADELRSAFLRSTLQRARTAGMVFSQSDLDEIRAWLAVAGEDGQDDPENDSDLEM